VHYEAKQGDFTISTDPARLDVEVICGFLRSTYWARQRPRATMEKAIRHSLCFGVYLAGRQIGFARAITDYATFAYMADVFILEPYRGKGLGKWLVRTMLEHPELKGLRRWSLLTQDAHSLYAQCGFTPAAHPEHVMERLQDYPAPQSG
jgi:GNAT superfamily N-acetyltransferase